jgi:hypothetical protein
MARLQAVVEEPDGLVYQPGILTDSEERAVAAEFVGLDFGEVRMHGRAARRTVLHFAYRFPPHADG